MNHREDCIELENEVFLGEITKILSEGKKIVLKAKGNSMLPFIHNERDSVVLEKRETVRVGDIVLADVGKNGHKRFVLHRIIGIESDIVTLMGDGNVSGTESCSTEKISGTVIAIETPNGSRKSVPDGRIWRKLLPVRRYILAVYRRYYNLKCRL